VGNMNSIFPHILNTSPSGTSLSMRPRVAVPSFSLSVTLQITSIVGGKDLSEEIFDFLLVRLKPSSSRL